MAHTLIAGSAPALNTNSFFAPIKNLFGSLRKMIEKRHTMNQLNNLDDRMLSDIGLTRGDLSNLG